jgi:predicted nucleic acid-binding protein
MAYPYIDTNVIIRFLTNDDPVKQERTAKLFQQVEQGTLTVAAPDTVIADAVFVLSSRRLYKLPRHEVAALLIPLVRLAGFRVKNRRTMLTALSLYGHGPVKVDFGDALIVASMRQNGSDTVYSFDSDFDKLPGINRQEPWAISKANQFSVFITYIREHDQHDHHEREDAEGPFWQFDEIIGEGPFFNEQTAIRLMAHISAEHYYRSTDLDELVPVQSKYGSRVYVLARPYILKPDYRLTVNLYPQPDERDVIGEVASADWVGMHRHVVGQAQAWHYPEDRTLILWECFLEDWCRKEEPVTDDALRAAWLGFEAFLTRHLSIVERIVTPSWEPLYTADELAWPAFLQSVGYKRIGPRAFAKGL